DQRTAPLPARARQRALPHHRRTAAQLRQTAPRRQPHRVAVAFSPPAIPDKRRCSGCPLSLQIAAQSPMLREMRQNAVLLERNFIMPKLTTAQAIILFLTNQYVERDGVETPFFAGCWGIFGHGN